MGHVHAAVASPQATADSARSDARAASLVVQTAFVGDVILTTPLIAELAERGPVDVVVTPAGAAVLANNPAVRHVIVYDKRGADGGLGGLRRVARAVRESGAANVYLAQGSVRSALLAAAGGGRSRRVGFDGAPARWLYTERVPLRGELHHAERLWRLAFSGGAVPEPDAERLRPRLYPSPAERDEAARLLSAAPPGRPIVALAPGSAWGTKRWPYFPELARALSAWATLAVVGGREDHEAGAAIAAASQGTTVIDATGHLSLLGAAALIARAALLVTNDSAPQHLASAMGIPTVTLFGPTSPSFGFGPLAPRSVAIGVEELSCRPCHHHGPRRCPLGHWRCMRDLDVARVASLATSIVRAP